MREAVRRSTPQRVAMWREIDGEIHLKMAKMKTCHWF